MKKIKDLPKDKSLEGVKVKTPNGVVGLWKSQWQKGVWLSDGNTSQVYPQFVEDLKECLEWEITEDEINCHKKKEFHHIDNKLEFKKGNKVHYDPGFGKKENGIVKSVSSDGKLIFVVYNCNNEWSRYEDFTAASTRIEDLKHGWI